MLNNNKYFNQLLITSDNIRERLSIITEGFDMEKIIKLIDDDIENNYSDKEKFSGEIVADDYIINFCHDFVQYNAMFVCDEWAKRKFSEIIVGNKKKQTVMIIVGNDCEIVAKITTPNKEITLKVVLDKGTGNVSIKQKDDLKEETTLDEKNMKILNDQNNEKRRLAKEKQEKEEAEAKEKERVNKLYEEIVAKRKVLNYAIDYYTGLIRLELEKVPAYLISRDFTFNNFENEEYVMSILENAGERKNDIKDEVQKIIALILSLHNNFVEEVSTKLLSTPVFNLIPVENFITFEDYEQLDEKKESDPTLYYAMIKNLSLFILNYTANSESYSRTPRSIGLLGVDDASKKIEVCYDSIRFVNLTCEKNEVIRFLDYILHFHSYYGLKNNIITFNLSSILQESFNPNFSEEEKAEILEYAIDKKNSMTADNVAKSIKRAQEKQPHNKLIDANIDIYEELNGGYTLAKRK